MTTPGYIDGQGAAARFSGPSGIATDSSGNVFVVDSNNQLIRKITSAGLVSTLAGIVGNTGSANGTGTAASFNFNSFASIATDSAGNVYVTDTNNNSIRKITAAGIVTTLAGSGAAGQNNGTGTSANFNMPTGIATDSAGNIYVADTYNHQIRKISSVGVVTTLAGSGSSGSTDGPANLASFNMPTSLTVDSAGNIYVADTYNDTIRKITATGTVSTLAGTAGMIGSNNATGVAATFNYPYGIVADSLGNIYVADKGSNSVRKITSGGIVTTVVGSTSVNSFTSGALPGGLSYPLGVALSGTTLYITTGQGVASVNNVP